MAMQLTDSNFKTSVLDSNKVAIIDFWAEWCGPCKAIGPIIDELSKEYEGKAVVGKVDVDNNPETAMKYGIRNIPTILFIKNGQVVDKQVGAVPKAHLVAMLNKHLS
jgi:thioredoxin 1